MSFADVIKTLLEIFIVGFALWAVFNKDRIDSFEDRLVARFRRRQFKVIRGGGVKKTCYPDESVC